MFKYELRRLSEKKLDVLLWLTVTFIKKDGHKNKGALEKFNRYGRYYVVIDGDMKMSLDCFEYVETEFDLDGMI